VARGVTAVKEARPRLGVVLVTHYERILDRLRPDVVHLMVDGRIVTEGGPELASRIEKEGYEAWR
jgi:Fe-S cluster assembly ATP-binding protein